jgi:hypothetical protein
MKYTSENEKNLTPNERVLLNSLNVRANLILEFEEVLRAKKMPFNKDFMYEMSEDDLRHWINMLSDESQANLRKNHMRETKKNN